MNSPLLKRIWTLKSKAGIEEDNFRLLAYQVTGKESTKDMSDPQKKAFIKRILLLHPELKKISRKSSLRTPQKYPAFGKKEEAFGFFAFITPDQTQYIKDLISIINGKKIYNFTEDSLPLKMFKKSLSKLKRWEAQRIIEALKKISRRNLKEETAKK